MDKAAYTNGICYDGREYFLVGAAGESEDCTATDGGIGCVDYYMTNLPGSEELTGGDKWGGLSREDFVISSILSYRANGNKNGWDGADPSQPGFYTGYESDEHDMQRLGLSSIPVCGAMEARKNWQKFSMGEKNLPSANYPYN